MYSLRLGGASGRIEDEFYGGGARPVRGRGRLGPLRGPGDADLVVELQAVLQPVVPLARLHAEEQALPLRAGGHRRVRGGVDVVAVQRFGEHMPPVAWVDARQLLGGQHCAVCHPQLPVAVLAVPVVHIVDRVGVRG